MISVNSLYLREIIGDLVSEDFHRASLTVNFPYCDDDIFFAQPRRDILPDPAEYNQLNSPL